ncbi:AmmeMemoRadiSam system protein A, partial [bacterium]|nr:AmmeMemoRadiSam system protein A [bacterium]
KTNKKTDKKQEKDYSEEEQKYLLKLARDTIEYAFKNNGQIMPINNVPDKFKEKRGIFVTIHKNKKLRGCIGYIETVEKIYKAVQNNALAAAFEDNRFTPLLKKELSDIKIEISILTIPKKTILTDIKPNIDGVILQQNNNQATYLPQVWKNVTNPEEFYSSLCTKAGLQADCYTNPKTEFYKYQAEAFSE